MLKVSIIVPAYNESKTIIEVLAKIRIQAVEGFEFEVIVVDDGSTDGTCDILEKYSRMSWFENIDQWFRIAEPYTSDRAYICRYTLFLQFGFKGFQDVISSSGKVIQRLDLPARPVPCGLAATRGRLIVTCIEGQVAAFEELK